MNERTRQRKLKYGRMKKRRKDEVVE